MAFIQAEHLSKFVADHPFFKVHRPVPLNPVAVTRLPHLRISCAVTLFRTNLTLFLVAGLQGQVPHEQARREDASGWLFEAPPP
jgi:hypothetical protein